MVKSQKKRNKKYTGVDAKSTESVVRVHKVNAVVRSDFRQWIFEHRKLLRYICIGVMIAMAIVVLFIL